MAASGRPPAPDDDSRDGRGFVPVEKLPELSRREREAVAAQTRPNAALIHETIRAEGVLELERKASALLFSGFAAGLSMGFSLLTEGLLMAGLPDASWRRLVASFGYTVGFLIVVLGRQQLFTENTITPVLPLLRQRDRTTLWRVLRLWGLVLAANMAGAWAFAAVLAHTAAFGPEVKDALSRIARHVPDGAFWTVFLKAVFAGWLIALMVWLLPAAETSRPFIIVVVTYVVAIGGLAHVIVGSVEVLYLVESGRAAWADFALRFFAPTLLGNVVGGVALVAALNYGQVAPEIERNG
ncbi:MAG TPA: formate/nitrite transporter family protein [Falsiroseomonas sp.]|jgi:formate/nitrite transporter FocA (FNT family)|nr:formate/nitrite transporter family protein [Falsiroseomonas sp.]